jgi:hypothetical protein
MQGWQTTYLGMRELPRDITAFELQAFFTFGHAERELIGARRGESLKLGLALHIGFVRMSGRVLDAFRVAPPALWRHLGSHPSSDRSGATPSRATTGSALFERWKWPRFLRCVDLCATARCGSNTV